MLRVIVCVVVALGLSGNVASSVAQAPAGIALSDDEAAILHAVNAARIAQKLPALVISARLMAAAREHAANMARQRTLDHLLDGRNLVDRLRSAGYAYSAAGENIAYGDGAYPVGEIFRGWMNSPPHRANILDPRFGEIGIGVATAAGRKYYTQVFATR